MFLSVPTCHWCDGLMRWVLLSMGTVGFSRHQWAVEKGSLSCSLREKWRPWPRLCKIRSVGLENSGQRSWCMRGWQTSENQQRKIMAPRRKKHVRAGERVSRGSTVSSFWFSLQLKHKFTGQVDHLERSSSAKRSNWRQFSILQQLDRMLALQFVSNPAGSKFFTLCRLIYSIH